MTIDELKAILDTSEAHYINSRAVTIKQYLDGRHKVLNRKDFTFKNEILRTSKILLQTVKSIVDTRVGYVVGNAATLTGDGEAVKLFNMIYDKASYPLTDYKVVYDLIVYGNAFEYVYKDAKGMIQSKVFDPLDSYPVYDDKGQYVAFVEFWHDVVTGNEYYNLYEPDTVTEYATTDTGRLMLTGQHRNLTGLPVHYTDGQPGPYAAYGTGIVSDLIPIMDELEALLSKTSDAVTTLSLNPLGVASGQKIDSRIDKDIVGAVLNLEDGGSFEYASAQIDHNTVQLLIAQLINQMYCIAEVPAIIFNSGNVSNVSEVSLKLLFSQLDNASKRLAAYLKQGIYQRWEAIQKLCKVKLTDKQFDSLDVSFNYNMPVDNSVILADLLAQHDAGALSKKSLIELSPYTGNSEAELAEIEKEKAASG